MILNKFLKNFILVFLSIFLVLIFLELFIRLILKDTPRGAYTSDFKDQPIAFTEDEILGWKPKIGKFTFRPWADGGQTINLTNLKDGSRLISGSSEKKKIIFIGGSLTQGWAVDDKDTFSWALQKKTEKFKIKNYGVGGYGGVQSLLKLKNIFKSQKDIKIVVYGFIPHHEVRNIASGSWMHLLLRASQEKEPNVFIPYASIKDEKLKIYKPKKYLKLPLGEKSALVTKIEKRILKISSFKRTFQELEISKKILLEMRSVSKKNGSKFVLIFLNKLSPEKSDLYAEFLKKNSIQYINCHFPSGKQYRVIGEGHPNGTAHKYVANCIYDKLISKIK